MSEPTRFLTVAEVARAVNVSQMTIRRLIDREELPALRIGRSIRIRRSAVDAYLANAVIGGTQ